jgi:DNA-binding CsgD family transcriptional regulator
VVEYNDAVFLPVNFEFDFLAWRIQGPTRRIGATSGFNVRAITIIFFGAVLAARQRARHSQPGLSMLRTDLVAAASEELLSAAMLGTPWEEALASLAIAAGARGVTLIRNRNRRLVAALANSEISEAVATYLAGGAPPNSRQVRVSHHSHDGFRIDHDDYTKEQFAKDPFYQEYLRPIGMFWHANARLSFEGDEELAISFKRELRRGPFTPKDAVALNAILPNVRVAARIALRVLDAQASGLAQWLHRRGEPVFEIDHRGRVLRSHGFEDGESLPLRLVAGRLVAADAHSQAQLDRAVMTVIGEPQRPAAVALPTHGGRRHFLQLIPVKARARDVFLSACAIAVLIARPGRPRFHISSSLVGDAFHLTDRELDIAMLIADGFKLGEIARSLRIQPDTVRFHLKKIFEKTDTHRQTELVVLLASLTP